MSEAGDACAICKAWYHEECAWGWDADEQMEGPGDELLRCVKCDRAVCGACGSWLPEFTRVCVDCSEGR
jgi:hypothetical protein